MVDQLAYREGSERWIDFFSYWKRDPIGMVNLCGRALGENAMYTEDFFNAYGRSIFEHWKIPQRIDFLYNHSPLSPDENHRDNFNESVRYGVTDNVPWIIDIDGQYKYIGIALFRNLDLEQNIYAIRVFIPEEFEDELVLSWNGPLDVFEGIIGRSLEVGDVICHHYIEHGHSFWNFARDPEGGLEFPARSDGFCDMITTKRIAHLLLWTTNMLGFQA